MINKDFFNDLNRRYYPELITGSDLIQRAKNDIKNEETQIFLLERMNEGETDPQIITERELLIDGCKREIKVKNKQIELLK